MVSPLLERLDEDLDAIFFDSKRGFALDASHFEDVSDPTPQFVKLIFDEPFFEFDEGFATAVSTQPPEAATLTRYNIQQGHLLDITFHDGAVKRYQVLNPPEDDGTGVSVLQLQVV